MIREKEKKNKKLVNTMSLILEFSTEVWADVLLAFWQWEIISRVKTMSSELLT